jgi:L-alanine-DL-glutamate epimerase-like enolase superfamily enzyme
VRCHGFTRSGCVLEQPLAVSAAAFQRDLVATGRVDIAADEAVGTVADAATVARERSATVINIGHSKLGLPPRCTPHRWLMPTGSA